MREGRPLSIFAAKVTSNTTVRVEGQLDLTNYLGLSDSIVKFAISPPCRLHWCASRTEPPRSFSG
jgi:hypothetical protein